ncbi:hypothetical protein K9857_25985, partial [Pseudomonas sp. REP124]|uniref:hypothetical protein n=1 Tax=Pseudomonas sp. REP124 TaxID=2875731 RepID=UPI001CCA8DFA
FLRTRLYTPDDKLCSNVHTGLSTFFVCNFLRIMARWHHVGIAQKGRVGASLLAMTSTITLAV